MNVVISLYQNNIYLCLWCLGYPYIITRSAVLSIAPHTWPQLCHALLWLSRCILEVPTVDVEASDFLVSLCLVSMSRSVKSLGAGGQIAIILEFYLMNWQSNDSDMFVGVVALCYQHLVLITECHNYHKHSQSPFTNELVISVYVHKYSRISCIQN